ncbi:MAG TPA: pantetheine-phosphate adenylyltransferase [Flavobacteriales bacterium]|jgi:pantetheine-phosphate adenylyltransferase|nr:pantetheine-phosphate adenylyltransferase [Flavobacteriales bacterium]HIA11860.1 pantetheine-phosphate adenylyltransferase [Flavobacteriales bacterium]
MKTIAVFPGSFDPITKGHESIVRRALPLFDEVIVAIGINASKKYLYSLDQREQWIGKVFEGEDKVKVEKYEGLTMDFCKEKQAQYVLRGLRSSADFEFERSIAQMNKALAPDIDTVFMLSKPELSAINSTIVRDIIRNGGDASQFVPDSISL